MQSLCVFCGSSKGFQPVFAETAQQLGRLLARRNIRLVYGAGNVGLMGILADAVLEGGGEVLGVIPDFLKKKEVCHTGLTELAVTQTMHERKAIMAERSDAFLVLPGGFGTLDEMFEILTWKQLHLHRKPIGLLNLGGFYDHLLGQVRQMHTAGFIKNANLDLLIAHHDVEELLEKLRADAAQNAPALPFEDKWSDR